jgi:hypothetical protein
LPLRGVIAAVQSRVRLRGDGVHCVCVSIRSGMLAVRAVGALGLCGDSITTGKNRPDPNRGSRGGARPALALVECRGALSRSLAAEDRNPTRGCRLGTPALGASEHQTSSFTERARSDRRLSARAHGRSACWTLAIAASSSATSRTGVASRAHFLALRSARSFISSAFWRSLLLGGRWSLALTAWFRYAL